MRLFLTGRLRLLSGALVVSLLMTPVFADMTYTVKPGDSLFKIAKKFSVSSAQLVSYNQLADPNALALGQTLQVPTKQTDATEDVPAATTENATDPASAPSAHRKHTRGASRHATNPHALAAARAHLIAQRRQQSEHGKKVVAAAQEYLGTPYQMAGLSSRGIDCSGLVVRSMAVLGKDVPHHAATLYQMGTPVSYEQLRPGDLVFFHTTGPGVTHVGIWVGHNQFIHASCAHGVTVEQLKGYYAQRLVGARRIK